MTLVEPRQVRLCVLGFGNVSQRLFEILNDRRRLLEAEFGLRVLVSAVGTRSHGCWAHPQGDSPADVLGRYRAGSPGFGGPACDSMQLMRESAADVLIESTPLQHGGTAAIHHVEHAFDNGLDVITVNKGPIAWDFRRLSDLAAQRGRGFRFEGVTMDGCPVYNLAEYCLRGDRVVRFRGVLNSTTNFILDEMAKGMELPLALSSAQREGICEADPSYDIDGHDAAAKVAALANVLMDADVTPEAVSRDSIRDLTIADVSRVRDEGKRLRVICTAERNADGSVAAGALLEQLADDDPMFGVSGTSSALSLETELAGTVEIVERGGLLTQTAYAIYSDLIALYAHS